MKSYIPFLAAILAAIVFSTGCKKYEDGPMFSLKPKKMRLVGEWSLVSINGEDINEDESETNTIYTGCGTEISYTVSQNYQITWEFENDGDFIARMIISGQQIDYSASYSSCSAVYIELNEEDEEKGDWEFEDKKKEIEISMDGERVTADILRLTSKQLWLELEGDKLKLEKK